MNEVKATTRSPGVLFPNYLAGGQGSERNLDTGYSEGNALPARRIVSLDVEPIDDSKQSAFWMWEMKEGSEYSTEICRR